MNYVHLKPPTRAAESEPLVDADLFEDRGIPVDLFNLHGQGFALEAYENVVECAAPGSIQAVKRQRIAGSLIWAPGLSFEDITSLAKVHDEDEE